MSGGVASLIGVAMLGGGAGWILRGWIDNINFYKDRGDE